MSKSFCFISKKQNYDTRHIEVLGKRNSIHTCLAFL